MSALPNGCVSLVIEKSEFCTYVLHEVVSLYFTLHASDIYFAD